MDISSSIDDTIGFTVEVTSVDPVHIVVTGDVDAQTSPKLREAITASAGSPSGLTIDLDKVGFIDSAGISSLLEARAIQADLGSRVTLLAAPPQVTRLLQMLDLREQFDFAEPGGSTPEP